MATIVELSPGKRATCIACKAVVEYMPEEVEERHHSDGGWRRVKCPRPRCPGYAYESTW